MKTLTLLLSALVLGGQAPPSPRMSAGIVTGRVGTASGAPAAGVRVSLLEAGASQDTAAMMGLTETDGAGHYRLEGVPPGRYYVMAGLLEIPTYYPGVKDRSKATVVTVDPGATLPAIDFPLVQSTGVTVRGRLTGLSQDMPGGLFRVSMIPAAVRTTGTPGSLVSGTVPAVAGAGGTFQFEKVMPGSYRFQVTPRTDTNQAIQLEVDARDLSVEIPVGPVLWGRVRTLEGSKLPVSHASGAGAGPVMILMVARNAARNQLPLPPGDGAFLLPALPAGDYTLEAALLPFGYSVVSITYAGFDLLRTPMKIPPADFAGGSIDVVVSATPLPGEAAGVKVSGRVTGPAEFAPGSQWVVMQSAGANILSLSGGRSDEAAVGPDGAFEFRRVPPGAYTVRPIVRGGPSTTVAVTVSDFDVTGVELKVAAPAPIPSPGVSPPPSSSLPNQSPPPELQPPSRPPGVAVSGRVIQKAPSGPPLPRAVVLFGPRDGLAVESPVKPDGSFEMKNVEPGTYDLRTLPLSGTVPSKRLVVGSSNLTGVEIEVDGR